MIDGNLSELVTLRRPMAYSEIAALSCYTSLNSQRYTLMAEDAVEPAGAKAPAITISPPQIYFATTLQISAQRVV